MSLQFLNNLIQHFSARNMRLIQPRIYLYMYMCIITAFPKMKYLFYLLKQEYFYKEICELEIDCQIHLTFV